jgi:hypothetical protein
MIWLIRAAQVSSLTYRIVLSGMMTYYLIREGLSKAQKRKLQRALPPPEPAS